MVGVERIELSLGIEPPKIWITPINSNGYKIWNESVNIKTNGEFSTLNIAGGSGWENNGEYILKAQYGDLENEIEFIFKT